MKSNNISGVLTAGHFFVKYKECFHIESTLDSGRYDIFNVQKCHITVNRKALKSKNAVVIRDGGIFMHNYLKFV